METLKGNSPVRPYDTPAVVYEAALVARAETSATTTGTACGCPLSIGDLLSPPGGN